MMGELDDRERWLVPLSLCGSCLANDGEEWLTMARTARRTLERLPRGVPVAPVLRDVTDTRARVAISFMGLLYGAAVIDGIRTRGKGWLYQDVQWAFGWHGLGHVGASLLTRGYTSGVATSPTVVLPQLAYAERRLRDADVPRTRRPLRAVTVLGTWLCVSHLLARRLPPGATKR